MDIELKRGETIGILGRNGAGKSTLLQLLCGTQTPSTGSIETRGRISALLELGAGFNPDFTGRENVFLYGAVLGLKTTEIEQRLDAILAFAEIGEFIDLPVKTYSSGMFVRLAFSVAINVDPDVLIVDEPLPSETRASSIVASPGFGRCSKAASRSSMSATTPRV